MAIQETDSWLKRCEFRKDYAWWYYMEVDERIRFLKTIKNNL